MLVCFSSARVGVGRSPLLDWGSAKMVTGKWDPLSTPPRTGRSKCSRSRRRRAGSPRGSRFRRPLLHHPGRKQTWDFLSQMSLGVRIPQRPPSSPRMGRSFPELTSRRRKPPPGGPACGCWQKPPPSAGEAPKAPDAYRQANRPMGGGKALHRVSRWSFRAAPRAARSHGRQSTARLHFSK